jgi:hypothetical protein
VKAHVLFRRQQADSARRSIEPAPGSSAGEGRCSGLEKALHFVLRRDQPRVLDLGPMCGATVTFLAALGARVTVEEFEAPSTPGRIGGATLLIDQPSGSFDLVLAWEHVDFMPPDRVREFGAELRRVLAPDGWVFLMSRAGNDTPVGRRARFRVLERNRVVREPIDEMARTRFVHSARAIEAALGGFLIEGIHLRRDQTREVVATRAGIERGGLAVLGEPRRTAAGPTGGPAPADPPAASRPSRPAPRRRPARRAPPPPGE